MKSILCELGNPNVNNKGHVTIIYSVLFSVCAQFISSSCSGPTTANNEKLTFIEIKLIIQSIQSFSYPEFSVLRPSKVHCHTD